MVRGDGGGCGSRNAAATLPQRCCNAAATRRQQHNAARTFEEAATRDSGADATAAEAAMVTLRLGTARWLCAMFARTRCEEGLEWEWVCVLCGRKQHS